MPLPASPPTTGDPASGLATFEWVQADPAQCFRWYQHGHPCAVSRWNFHPETEIHLIREVEGMAFVGDHIGRFGPGYLAAVGANLPHNWVPDVPAGTTVDNCHVVLQFDGAVLVESGERIPELRELAPFLDRVRRGVVFHGAAARDGAALMERIGTTRGLRRFALFLELLCLLADTSDCSALSSDGYAPTLNEKSQRIMHEVMAHILTNLDSTVRMADIAKRFGMSEPTFCRFFRRNTGSNFVDYLRRLRIGRACHLLTRTSTPVTDICFDVGYRNIPNFNRHFRLEKGTTPSQYRKMARENHP
ncbi:AraC family transcriptional regulator [Azospirillum griseum]|uniref:AraC family transcriptional regulator n=1 Tax=Azospirillum griseum TaxID=2496639 RepID=A0A3S0IEA6_9PROT|nr:AraC family transcriptional regulator [Azospirillum griseum]RTR18900.1 AraC family transcriptional regulator [Azospirillum griseum]